MIYSRFDVVTIAASLGGPAALSSVLNALPPDFPCSVLVVQHLSASSAPLVLDQLKRQSLLPLAFAEEGQLPQPARAYLAPPDHHLLLDADRRFRLSQLPRVKFCRPAAEPLFASAAGCYRERTLGVVLTGCNSDGALGVQTIKWMGGCVLAQEPATARASGMPRAAIATGAVDYVIPLERIAAALIALVMAPGLADYLRVCPAAA